MDFGSSGEAASRARVPAAGHAKQDGHTSGGAVIIRRILLADDNQDFADSLAMLLRRRVTKLS